MDSKRKVANLKINQASKPTGGPTVAGCQLDIVWEDKDSNFERICSMLRKKRLAADSLLVLPEMFATGFSMNATAIVESHSGRTMKFLSKLAREKGIYIIGGLALFDRSSEAANQAVCVSPAGKCVAQYSKIQLFTPGCEAQNYQPGSEVTVFNWNGLKVAINICYDLRFPELFRMATQRGAEVLVIIANWPSRRHEHWLALLRSRAIENQAYIIAVNRCGNDPFLGYRGGSMVIDPWGETISSAGNGEKLFSARIDRGVVKKLRRDFAVLRDARTQFKLVEAGQGR